MAKTPGVRIAASPINWHNDDFPILGAETSVATILGDIQRAGYDGTALSSLFPSTVGDLLPLLQEFDLELAGGWHSAYLLTREYADEKRRFIEFVTFVAQMGSTQVTIAESSFCPFKPYPGGRFDQNFPALAVPLFPFQLPILDDGQWSMLARGLTEFSSIAADHGVTLGYHPHMQTVVQDEQQLARLADVVPDLQFTIDTGHMKLTGADPVAIVEKYIDRICSLHIKNVRDGIAAAARNGSMGFAFAVIEGVFTVPGDGGIDFTKIFEILKAHEYSGWLLVEAEQNPLTSDPYLYAKLAREYIRAVAAW